MDLFSLDIGAPFAKVRHFEAMVGGSPTNIAIATTRLGLHSVAFSAVGEDRVGDLILDYLEEQGVTTEWVFRIAGKPSSIALLGVEPPNHFPLSFYRDDPADIHLTIDQAATLPFAETTAVLLSGTGFSRGTLADTSRYIAQYARTQGMPVFIDLDLRPTEWKTPADYGQTMRTVLPLVDVVIGTEEEFWSVLSDEPAAVMNGARVPNLDQLDSLISGLSSLGPPGQVVVTKRSSRGATIFEESIVNVPGFAVEVVNTVGAGDAFASGLITRRLKGDDWVQAATYANACGAIEVQRHGCSTAFPYDYEVAAFLAERMDAAHG